jgi:cytoskeletal protein CcmA (bactofilin family)
MALNSPGVPGSNLPAGEDHVMRRLADIERRMREMQAADILKPAGLQARPNGMTVFGELDVSGPLAVTGPATIGGTLGVTGPTTISNTLGTTTLGATTGVTGALNVSGPMAVTGTLSLPAGIINNAALAEPVKPGTGYGSAANFAVTTTATAVASITATVPAGFSQAMVFAAGRVYAINGTATADALYTRVKIAADTQYGSPTGVGANGGYATSVAANAALVTGLTGGGTFTIAILTQSTNGTWAANAANAADISATILWLR